MTLKLKQEIINEILLDAFQEYKKPPRKERGIPVFAFAVVNGKIVTSFSNKKVEKNIKNQITHAEHLLINWIFENKSKYKQIEIYITLSPCKHCRKLLESINAIVSVIYFMKNINDPEMHDSEKIKQIVFEDYKNDVIGFHLWNKEIIGHQNRMIRWKRKNKCKIMYESDTLNCICFQNQKVLVTLNETNCKSFSATTQTSDENIKSLVV